MKCQHCNYEHGWSGESMCDIQGKEGAFFELPIKLEQEGHYSDERMSLYGCPRCKKVFMEY